MFASDHGQPRSGDLPGLSHHGNRDGGRARNPLKLEDGCCQVAPSQMQPRIPGRRFDDRLRRTGAFRQSARLLGSLQRAIRTAPRHLRPREGDISVYQRVELAHPLGQSYAFVQLTRRGFQLVPLV